MDFFTSVFQNQNNADPTNRRQQSRRTPPTAARNGNPFQQGNPFQEGPMSVLERAGAAMMAHAAAAGSGAQQEERAQPQPQQGAAPSASQRAIRQLPTIVVSSEDLVDENNRECCICFEEHNIGDKVIRLPCAHIYHTKCITEWLSRHCTCPVCRYELPTDDPAYEADRKIRMSNRKPRFARYELERMAMKDLIHLCRRLKLNNALVGGPEKKEVVQAIIDSRKIDIIVAPEPVEYESIGVLRGMGVGKLKRAMAEAGVFFDAKDVVEKEDMVQIFVNSGRVALRQIEEGKNDDYGHTSYDIKNEGIDEHIDDGSYAKRARREEHYSEGKWDHSSASLGTSEDPDNVSMSAEKPAHVAVEESWDSLEDYVTVDFAGDDTERGVPHSSDRSRTTMYNDYGNSSSNATLQSAGFTRTSVASLRELAGELHIDISDCIEKKEMTDRILAAVSRRRT